MLGSKRGFIMCFSFSHSHTGKELELPRCLHRVCILPGDSLAHEGDRVSNPRTGGQPAVKSAPWPTTCISGGCHGVLQKSTFTEQTEHRSEGWELFPWFWLYPVRNTCLCLYLFCLSFSSSQNYPLIFALLSLLSPHLSSHHRALITHFSLCDCSYSFSSLALSLFSLQSRSKNKVPLIYH